MSKLFLPEGIENQDLEKILEPKEIVTEFFEDTNFVFACGNELLMLPIVPEYDSFHGEPISLCEREDHITDICEHDGKLYDVDAKGYVRETFTDTIYIDRFINPIKLCSHKGDLYLACQHTEIFNVLKKRQEVTNILEDISDLASYQGQLLASTEPGRIYDAENNVIVKDIQNEIINMCVHKSKLYYTYRGPQPDSYRAGILGHSINVAMDTPGGYPRGLCSYQGYFDDNVFYPTGKNILELGVEARPIAYQQISGGQTFEMPGMITCIATVKKSVMDQR